MRHLEIHVDTLHVYRIYIFLYIIFLLVLIYYSVIKLGLTSRVSVNGKQYIYTR